MKEQLEAIRAAAKKALSDCADSKVLETLRVQYLGKKGELTGILKQMGKHVRRGTSGNGTACQSGACRH